MSNLENMITKWKLDSLENLSILYKREKKKVRRSKAKKSEYGK